MTSFRNTLVSPAREYVTAGAPSAEFRFTWDGATLTGASGGWSCAGGTVSRVDAGGEPALQLDVSVARPGVTVTKHYVIYPEVALIREWTDYANTGSAAHELAQPSFLEQKVMGGVTADTDFNDMLGAYQYALETVPLTADYATTIAANASTDYEPWFSLFDRRSRDGVYVGFDYMGQWAATVGQRDGSGESLSLALPNYDAAVAPGQVVSSPKAFAAVYKNELDDMTQRILDWQYTYLWDYTRAPYFTKVEDEGPNYQVGDSDTPGLTQMVFGQVDAMRSIGVDTYHRDDGWWDFTGNWNGPDWKLTHDYLAMSGMKQIIYYFAYDAEGASQIAQEHPDWFDQSVTWSPGLIDLRIPAAKAWMLNLLVSNAQKWGDYQWRNDNFAVAPEWPGDKQLAQDQGFRDVLKGFLDARPGSGFHAVNGGGNEFGYDYLRFAEGSSMTDSNGFYQQWGGSMIYPADKLSGVPEDMPVYDCTAKYDTELMWNPDLQGDTADPAALECIRKVIDLYHYITAQHVTGRWVQQYHPHGTDTDINWFERLSGDSKRGLVIYKGDGSADPVTVYPKGLDPKRAYDVRFQFQAGASQRTGADLMANGVAFPALATGELIWLNMPGHPGSGTDRTPPSAPEKITATAGTQMSQHGVEVTWPAARDSNWISYYELSRDGTVLGKVASGTYYFDHTPGAAPGDVYSVVTVDGDGNRSPATATTGTGTGITAADDTSAAITYTGTWTHQNGMPGPDAGTLSAASGLPCHTACQHFSAVQGQDGWSYQDGPPPPPGPCHLGCQQFSGTQGQDGWSYQFATAGVWNDITTYHQPFGFLGECCAWYDFSSSDFSGLITPRLIVGGAGHDTARAWTAPKDGVIDISAQAVPSFPGNQAVLTITKNDQPIWGPATMDGTTTPADTSVPSITVTAGDVIRFVVAGTATTDISQLVNWDPDIHYQGDPPVPPAVPPPGTWNDIAAYHQGQDYTSDGEYWNDTEGTISARYMQPGPITDIARAWTAPSDGVINIGGHAAKAALDASGPDSTISITKNDQVIWGPQTIAGNDTTGTGTAVQNVTVAAGDVIRFVVTAGGGITAWDPDVSYAGDPAPVARYASASWTFTGSQVRWYAQLSTDKAIAQVLIDGKPDALIDLYAPNPDNWSVPIYTKTFPAAGTHTITITGTGAANSRGDGTTVGLDVDGFQAVTTAPAVTQDTSHRLSYTGTGWAAQSSPDASGGTIHTAATAGNTVSYTFTGTAITWTGRTCAACGEADVYLDGKYVTRVDTFGYRGPQIWQSLLFQQSWAHPGEHTLKIVVDGTKNFFSAGTEVDIDSFQIIG
jgi:hypothetical protein